MGYITSTTPTKYKLSIYRFLNFILGPLGRFLLRRKFNDIHVTGTEHLRGGPKLLVMNHSCPLDPVIITFFGRQPLQFLITEPFMQGGLGSKIASSLGQITKRKLDLDPSSIQLMKRWSDLGAHVALFPEGKFSWDGDPSPLMPGLDSLIKYLKLPVVCVHLANGNRVKPAWARFMRRTSISIHIHPALTLESEKDIVESIKTRIFPESSMSFPSSGINLADGLARIVRFCPKCEADSTLTDTGNVLVCKSCNERTEVDADNSVIKPLLAKTYLLLDRLSSLQSIGDVALFNATKKDWVLLSENKLNVNFEGVFLGDFHLSPTEIIDHTLDWGDFIILKTRKQRYALKLPHDSRLIFDHLIKKIRHA